MRLAFISIIALTLFFSAGVLASADNPAVSFISEQCGDWKVGFNWSSSDDYKKSASHGNSESGGVKVETDTLIITSTAEPKETIKLSIMKYLSRDRDLVNTSILMLRADEALSRSGVCKRLSASARMIEGRPGAFVSGSRCSDGEPVYIAVYPVSYYFDKSGRALASDALGVIVSTYDFNTTERLISSIKIEQNA